MGVFQGPIKVSRMYWELHRGPPRVVQKQPFVLDQQSNPGHSAACYQFIQIAHSIIVHNFFPILETGRGMAGHNWVSSFQGSNCGRKILYLQDRSFIFSFDNDDNECQVGMMV